MNRSEFVVGDRVTYHPFEFAHKAEVVEVLTDHPFFKGEYSYRLKGRKNYRVNATTTGRCIEESKHFVEYDIYEEGFVL